VNNAVHTRLVVSTEQERLYLRATEVLQQTLALVLNPGRLAALKDTGVFGSTYEFTYTYQRATNRLHIRCIALGLTAIFRIHSSSSTLTLEQFSGTSHEAIVLSHAMRQLLMEPMVSTGSGSKDVQPMQLS
jgi:hypothetical protein